MAGVRKTFCTVVSSGAGGSSSPRKNGISGCIPAETSSVERSSARGISDAEGRNSWPLDSKKARNPARSSAVERMAVIVGAALALPAALAGGEVFGLDRDLLADLLQRAADEPGDVHLRDADLLRDLGLRQPLEEPEVQDHALALVEDAEARREHGEVLRDLVLMLLGAERLERVELALVVLARTGGERERAVGPPALERLEHLFLAHLGGLRELSDRGRTTQLDGELLEQPRKLNVQLLEPARDAHRPPAVAEVALDLADDVRRRVGGQLDAAVEIEAVDRLDQADGADLHQVLELLAAVRITPGEGAHERHVLLDQLLARREVTLGVVAAKQDLVARRHQPPSSVSRRFVSSSQPSRSSS